MKKFALLLLAAATASLSACSPEAKTETTTTETTTTTGGDTATVFSTDTVATGPAAPMTDSVRHAHLHESKGMVHNHEHGHPASDTAHRGQ